jgi:hypothetical protein
LSFETVSRILVRLVATDQKLSHSARTQGFLKKSGRLLSSHLFHRRFADRVNNGCCLEVCRETLAGRGLAKLSETNRQRLKTWRQRLVAIARSYRQAADGFRGLHCRWKRLLVCRGECILSPDRIPEPCP